MISHKLLFLPALVLLALPVPGYSQKLIDVNFNDLGQGSGKGAAPSGQSSDVWNTFNDYTGSGTLKYTDGSTSPVSINYKTQDGTHTLLVTPPTYSSGIWANTGGLMDGFLYDVTETGTIQLTGLSAGQSFTLYVLVYGGGGQAGRHMTVTVNGTPQSAGPSPLAFTTFSQGTTYLNFPGTADSSGAITITFAPSGTGPASPNWNEADVNGFQLVLTAPPPNPCASVTLSASGESFPAAGGGGTVNVTADAACSWSVSGAPDWVTITGGASGSGDGTVSYTVAANTDPAARSGAMTIAALTYTVEQEGASTAGLNFAGSMAQIASAGSWDTLITLVNAGEAAAEARLNFFSDPAGSPLLLPFTFPQQPARGTILGTTFDSTVFGGTFHANAMLLFDTTGPVDQVGSAQLLTNGAVSGFAVFKATDTGQEAVAPLETGNASSYILAFDNTGGIVTGVAIANVASAAGNVPVVIRDDTGAQIGTGSIPLAASGHTSFVLTDATKGFPVTAGKRGTVEFDTPAGGQISVLGLRFPPSSVNAFTSVPVLANVTSSGGTMAHLASADSWKTTITLVNTGTASANAHLHFFGDSGSPLSLPLSFPQGGSSSTTASALDESLAAGAMLIIESTGPVAQVGSAQLTTDGAVSGFAVFKATDTGQEAVVPLETRNPASFMLAFDNTGGIVTGVAIANVASQAGNVPVVIRDDTGTEIGTGSIALAAEGHKSFVLTDATTGFPVTAGKRGTIEFETPAGGQISVLGLRFPPSNANAFTTIPVMTKSTATAPGGRLFAPYIDMGLPQARNLSSISSASGIRRFTMGFVINGSGASGCTASWFGTNPVAGDTTLLPLLNALRAVGGDAIISFGGESGTELGDSCTAAASLQAQYQSVITTYNEKMLDFDIEGLAVTNTAGIDRRNTALAGLQAANSGLVISYTLPVLPTGLTSDGVNILTNAKSHSVNVAVVNVMAMDYGSADSQMGQDAINATEATYAQVQAAGLSSTMGCTPMIGQNDSPGEIFSLADAQTLVNWAKGTSYATRLAFWSVGRDNGSCAGSSTADASCSSIAQSTYEFANIFEDFN